MRRIWRSAAAVAAVWMMSVPIPAMADPAEVEADCVRIKELCAQYADSFEGIYGNTMVYGGKADEAAAALAKVQGVEKDVLPVLRPVMADFAEKYGVTAMEISNKLHQLGAEDQRDTAHRFEDLYRGMENVVKSRRTSAEFIATNAGQSLSGMDSFTPEIRLRKLEEAKALLVVGHGFDPNNADINEMLGTIDQRIDEMAQNIEADIDSKSWAGHVGDFPGPGDVKSLEKAALDFFRKSPQWTGNAEKGVEILAVAVRGPWQMAETNLFGMVIQWRLPIHLAITNKDLKTRNVARVYELSALTFQGEPGRTPKEPPFEGYWVGNNWMMRLDKLK